LLGPQGDDRAGNAARLSWGVLGLSLFGLLPSLALCLVNQWPESSSPIDWLLLFILDALSLPAAALLTLTLALPGLAILLGVFDLDPSPRVLLNAASRAFYRMGFLALGATPTLTLYALTGASSRWIHLGTSLAYVAIGAVSLLALLRQLFEALPLRRGFGGPLVLGWACFVGLFGLHLFQRLNIEPWL
jgi:hypothetical protein